MGSLNKVMIIGRLGRDPEMRFTPSGQSVCSFSVATDSRWTNKAGEKQEKTEWHRVKAWGRLAELVSEYLRKGSQVFVEGRLETSEYTDKAGVKKYSTDLVANEVVFLGSKPEGARANRDASTPADPVAQDGIPF